MSEAAPVRARADMHVHTSFSGWRHLRLVRPRDCYSPPAEVYLRALERGMAFVAITDHNTVEGALRLLDDPRVDSGRVIVGEETECLFPETGQWVHLCVYGVAEADHAALARLRGDVRDVVAYCRERSLLCVLNHPFQSYLWQKPKRDYAQDILALFTHVEGLNGAVPALQNKAVKALCREAAAGGRALVQVAGSDAHTLRRVGLAYTEAAAATPSEFLSEVAAGRCSVGGDCLSTPGLLREVYEIVGTYYGRLYTGRGDAEGHSAYTWDVLAATACLPFALGGLPAAITVGNQIRQKLVSRAFLRKLEQKGAWLEPRPLAAALGETEPEA